MQSTQRHLGPVMPRAVADESADESSADSEASDFEEVPLQPSASSSDASDDELDDMGDQVGVLFLVADVSGCTGVAVAVPVCLVSVPIMERLVFHRQ